MLPPYVLVEILFFCDELTLEQEGAVFLILKKRSAALAAGDPIKAYIRAISTKHNGRTRSLITPNVDAQVAVTQDALKRAKLEPRDITILEGIVSTGHAD